MHLASARKGRTGTTRTAAQPCSPPSHNRAATARDDAARSKDQLLGVVMTLLRDCSQPRVTAPDRVPSSPVGTWTVDPSRSNVSFSWRRLRPWTLMGRLPCSGVIHLDELPPVGVRQFEQPSGLPVLTIALDPASVETQAADDVLRHRWWTLRSESLEILRPVPGGSWRRSPPTAARACSSCAWRSTPRRAAPTGWCCEVAGCWIDVPSGSPVRVRPTARRSGSTWSCGPGEWGAHFRT
jgi:hypothetical protein